MTALVGILNIRGAAIAADSAVTIKRYGDRKIVNSANKMLRLSSAQPVSLMICGVATFLGTPLEIIVRRYRQKRGNVSLPSVQAYVDDFFSYMVSEKVFFPEINEKKFLRYSLDQYFQSLERAVPFDEGDDHSKLASVDPIIEAFKSEIKKSITSMARRRKYPMFEDYTLEQFANKMSTPMDDFIRFKSIDFDTYPLEVYQAIRDDLVAGLMYYVTTRTEKDRSQLVFTGFGAEEVYPTLICAKVNGGFDGRVCYHIRDEDVVHISAEKPVAICPFAQTDIINSLLKDVNPHFNNGVRKCSSKMFLEFEDMLRRTICGEDFNEEFSNILKGVKWSPLYCSFERYDERLAGHSHNQWLKALRDYDLQNMAKMAENLIAMTNFERRMTFREEGVGGPIDLAIITRNHGFTWLNRKSWYNHVDVGGRYGRFGV